MRQRVCRKVNTDETFAGEDVTNRLFSAIVEKINCLIDIFVITFAGYIPDRLRLFRILHAIKQANIQMLVAHRIGTSEILPWDRKSYLIHAILHRLSREGLIHRLYWNSRIWSSNGVIVMLR